MSGLDDPSLAMDSVDDSNSESTDDVGNYANIYKLNEKQVRL